MLYETKVSMKFFMGLYVRLWCLCVCVCVRECTQENASVWVDGCTFDLSHKEKTNFKLLNFSFFLFFLLQNSTSLKKMFFPRFSTENERKTTILQQRPTFAVFCINLKTRLLSLFFFFVFYSCSSKAPKWLLFLLLCHHTKEKREKKKERTTEPEYGMPATHIHFIRLLLFWIRGIFMFVLLLFCSHEHQLKQKVFSLFYSLLPFLFFLLCGGNKI